MAYENVKRVLRSLTGGGKEKTDPQSREPLARRSTPGAEEIRPQTLSRWISLIAGVGLAMFAKYGYDTHFGGVETALLFAFAALLFLYGAPAPLRPRLTTTSSVSSLQGGHTRSTYAGMALAVGMAVVAAILLWNQLSGLAGLALWVGSLLLLCASAWRLRTLRPDDPTPSHRADTPRAVPVALEVGLLIILVTLALGVRLWNWESFPYGLQSDEGSNALDAMKWLAGHPYTPYSEINEGQATLFTYLIALSFRLLGADLFSLRLVPMLVGTATVIAFYFLVRGLFSAPAAFAGTALLAMSRWHITFSRIVYELILVPLAAIGMFYFLHRALSQGRPRHFVFAGLALAFGFNTYTGFRTIPIGAVLLILYWMLRERRRIGSTLKGALLFGLSSVMGLLPLGIYALQHPDVVLIRTRHLNIFGEIEAVGSLQPLWLNVRRYLSMFNYQGDGTPINNLPGEPMLVAGIGALLVLGIIYGLRHLRHPTAALALVWVIGVLPAGILSVTLESPSARRVIGMLPVILLLVTMVLDAFWRRSIQAWGVRKSYLWALTLGLFVLVAGRAELETFYQRQITHNSVRLAFSPVESSIGRYLDNLDKPAILFLDQYYHRHSAIRFLAREPEYTVLDTALHLPLSEPHQEDVIYILSPFHAHLRSLYLHYYPDGRWSGYRDPSGMVLYYTFDISPEAQESSAGLTAGLYPDHKWDEPATVVEHVAGLMLPAGTVQTPVFGAEWQGSLRAPVHGEYRLVVESPGPAVLRLNNRTRLTSAGGRESVDVALVSGFHTFALRADLMSGQDAPRLIWSGPVEEGMVPATAFYTFTTPPFGLVGTYYGNEEWEGIPISIQHDAVIASSDVVPSPYSIIWEGLLRVEEPGRYRFGTTSDDGSWLYLNGELVVDNGGHHGAQYREGPALDLDAGYHEVEIRYFQDGGAHKLELYWIPPEGGRQLIPPQNLVPMHHVSRDSE